MNIFSLWLEERIHKLKQETKNDDSSVLSFLDVVQNLDAKAIADFVAFLNFVLRYSCLNTLEMVKTVYDRLHKS